MRFDIITAVPDLLHGTLTASIVGRAVKNNIADIVVHNLRDYGMGNY